MLKKDTIRFDDHYYFGMHTKASGETGSFYCKSFNIDAYLEDTKGTVRYKIEMFLGNLQGPEMTYTFCIFEHSTVFLDAGLHSLFDHLNLVMFIRSIQVMPSHKYTYKDSQ